MLVHGGGRLGVILGQLRHSLRLSIALVALALCSGCAIPRQDLDRLVLVHDDGYAMNNERSRVVPKGTPPDEALSVFKSEWGDNILKGVDEKAAALSDGAPLKLLIFVHGGLNTYQGAMK